MADSTPAGTANGCVQRLGRKKAVFNIGHFNMEELGMRYAQDWIGDLVDHKVPVHYLPTKDIYRYIERKHL